MNYDNFELRDLLAGHFVLGRLRGRARKRFERLTMARADYARAVARWEEHLAPLALVADPVTPPRRVWRRVVRRVKRDRGQAGAPRAHAGWFGRGGLALAGVAFAAFFVMLGLYLTHPAAPPAPSQVAVIATSKGAPQWVVTVRDRHMHMHAVGRIAPPAGKSYELWMLPGHGAKPVSLGVLPVSGEASEALSSNKVAALESASGLAVSLEPPGGSPTGQPTGPVVFTAKLANI